MKTVYVDKIASITQALELSHDMRIATTDIPAEEGVVLVVEILTSKSTYNTLELTSAPTMMSPLATFAMRPLVSSSVL